MASYSKIKIPLNIINIIIDDFYDNRIKYIICNNKYSFNDALWNGNIEQCNLYNNWMCFEICCDEYYDGLSFYK